MATACPPSRITSPAPPTSNPPPATAGANRPRSRIPSSREWKSSSPKLKSATKSPALPGAKTPVSNTPSRAPPRYIAELKARSFLIAQADPFVVLPLSTRKYLKTDPFIPKVGDYCVVIYEDRMYPAIVGDYGPTTKVGEASLRIAKELNENSSPYRRPVSDLSVSYLYFPGSAEKPFRAPDYDHWHERCTALLEEMGGIGEGYTLHRWSDPFAEPAPPASESAPVDPTDPVAAPPAAAPATE